MCQAIKNIQDIRSKKIKQNKEDKKQQGEELLSYIWWPGKALQIR